MALYCPLPGQFLAIARQETTRQEEEGEATRRRSNKKEKQQEEGATRRRRKKKEREVERKRLLSLLLFTLHQIVWNPDKHWGSERWRVGSPLHHSSPLFTSSLSQPQSKTEAGHHWRLKLVIIEGRRPKPDSREDLASSKKIRVKSGWRVVKSWGNSSPTQAPHTQQLTSLLWRVKSKNENSFLFTRYEQGKGRLTSSQGLPPYTYS